MRLLIKPQVLHIISHSVTNKSCWRMKKKKKKRIIKELWSAWLILILAYSLNKPGVGTFSPQLVALFYHLYCRAKADHFQKSA